MTSRERISKVLNHEIPDFLPNGWGGCETAGLHILAYRRLVEILNLPPRTPRMDAFFINAVWDKDVIMKMQGDMMLVASPNLCERPLRSSKGWKTNSLFGIDIEMTDNLSLEYTQDMIYLLDNNKRALRCPIGGHYFDFLPTDDFAFEEIPDPAAFNPPHDFADEKLRELEDAAKNAYESTDFSLVMGESVRDLQYMPVGLASWYDLLLNEPDIADEFLSKCVDAALDQIVLLDQAVGKYCSMMSIAQDFGDTRGVTIGAPLFRSRYKPHYKRLFEGWHKRTNMKVNMHSCGSIAEIIPDLIECGVDVLNPIQVSTANMDPTNVKKLAGDKLVLFGGAFDCVQSPPEADEEAVFEQVCKNIAELGANGNYIFAGVHNIAATTPAKHLDAALRAYREMRNMYQSK